MSGMRLSRQLADAFLLGACLWGILGCQGTMVEAGYQQGRAEETPATPSPQQETAAPVIKTPSELPDAYPRREYTVRLVAIGGLQPLRWRLLHGALPPGIKLEDDGALRGAPERGGEFQFTLVARDSSSHQAQKQFTIHVHSALSLVWKSPAHVDGNRIEGSVEVSNATPDDMDLTFIVLAVAANGRATAIGYQHFPLLKGTAAKELPFGDTLPRGGYVVHVDAVGEVTPQNLIYRERMQTPGPLQVAVGP